MGCDAVRGQVRQKCIMRECVCVCVGVWTWTCVCCCLLCCRRVSDDELGLFWASGPFFGWEQGRYAQVCVCGCVLSLLVFQWEQDSGHQSSSNLGEGTNERTPWACLGPALPID